MVEEICRTNAGFEDCEFLIRSEDEVVEFVRRHAARIRGTESSGKHLWRVILGV